MVAEGYPGTYEKGRPISGLDHLLPQHVKVFHAGTRLEGERLTTQGGRVLCVTALGDTLEAAAGQAYGWVEKTHWDGADYRRDIGSRDAQ